MNEDALRASVFAGLPVRVGLARAGDEAGFAARPGEAELIAQAAPRRRADFARGRLAARTALAALGLQDVSLLADADRVPRWPAGVVGSIAHSGDVAVAVVARTADLEALGVDVEVATPIAEEEWDLILTPPERATVLALPPAQRGFAVLRHFCAKEAAYKAGFPARRTIVEFGAIQVTFTGDAFEARWAGSPDGPFAGRCVRLGEHQFAGAWRPTAAG